MIGFEIRVSHSCNIIWVEPRETAIAIARARARAIDIALSFCFLSISHFLHPEPLCPALCFVKQNSSAG